MGTGVAAVAKRINDVAEATKRAAGEAAAAKRAAEEAATKRAAEEEAAEAAKAAGEADRNTAEESQNSDLNVTAAEEECAAWTRLADTPKARNHP